MGIGNILLIYLYFTYESLRGAFDSITEFSVLSKPAGAQNEFVEAYFGLVTFNL